LILFNTKGSLVISQADIATFGSGSVSFEIKVIFSSGNIIFSYNIGLVESKLYIFQAYNLLKTSLEN
jgi:hypothetical protein